MTALTKIKVSTLALLLSACGASETHQASIDPQSGIRLGKEAQPGDEIAIGTVGIRAFNKEGHTMFCSGSLLPGNLVVTAAHCVAPDMTMFIVFSTDTDLEVEDFKKVARFIDGYAIHPKYKKNLSLSKDSKDELPSNNDIALVHYKGSTPANYQPVQILKDYSLLKPGTTITIAGYGVSNDSGAIEAAKNPKATHNASSTTSGVGKLRYTDVTLLGAINSSEILLDQSQGTGACGGDSGGPSYLRVDNQLYMFGVASRGPVRAKGSPCLSKVLYTAVAPYASFLNAAAKALAQKANSSQQH